MAAAISSPAIEGSTIFAVSSLGIKKPQKGRSCQLSSGRCLKDIFFKSILRLVGTPVPSNRNPREHRRSP
jgi:hypothetical protein